jgi:hypothetical protein
MKKRNISFWKLMGIVAGVAFITGGLVFTFALSVLYPEGRVDSQPFSESHAAVLTPLDTHNTYKFKMDDGNTGRTVAVPILMYHHVGLLPENPDALRQDLTVSPEDFAKQVAWFKQQGYTSVSLADVNEAVLVGKALPKKPIVFTFDDGYADVFEYAVPVLKSAGYTGSFAIITELPGVTENGNSYASWDKINEAKRDGMELVCHTVNHFDGSNIIKYNDSYIKTNLTKCREDLKTHTSTESTRQSI